MLLRAILIAPALIASALPANGQGAAVPPAFTQRDKGHCTACHQVADAAAPASRADFGPRLEGARMRELGRARLRALIHDPTLANPNTVMPPFGRHRILEPAELERLLGGSGPRDRGGEEGRRDSSHQLILSAFSAARSFSRSRRISRSRDSALESS